MTAAGIFSSRSERIALAILLAAALTLRLGWGLSRPAHVTDPQTLGDQGGYIELARNLLAGRGMNLYDPRFGQTVYAMRLPGYPLLLAALGANVQAVRIAQALLDTSTVLAIFLLSRRVVHHALDATEGGAHSTRHIPLVASALVAFNPFLIYFSALLLTETLFTAMLAWSLLLLTRRRSMIAGIAMLAVSIHVRPSAVGMPALLGAVAAWGFLNNVRLRRALAGAMVGALFSVLVLFPWAWRNHHVLGRWVWSSSNDGITLFDGFHPTATGASDQSFTKQMPHLSTMTELQRNDYLADAARKNISDNPARAVRLTGRKIARTWSPIPLSAEYSSRLYLAVGLFFSAPFDVLVVLGLWRGGLSGRRVVLLILPAAYFTAVHALSVGSLRYRVPAEPPLAIVAAAGAASLLSRAKKKPGERHQGLGMESNFERPSSG